MTKVALWIFSFISISMVFDSMALPQGSEETIEEPTTLPNEEEIAQMTAGRPYRIITPHKSLFIYNAPYYNRNQGEYILQDDLNNGYPVYTRKGTSGTTWSFYQRTNQKWYLDFNDVSEDWSGTVMYSHTAGFSPELLDYSAGYIFVDKVISTRLVPYHNGDYTFQGEVYNNAPVYTATTNYHMYKRSEGRWAGHWVIDFNDINEDWSGTIAYTLAPSRVPYGVQWNN